MIDAIVGTIIAVAVTMMLSLSLQTNGIGLMNNKSSGLTTKELGTLDRADLKTDYTVKALAGEL